MPPKKNKGKMEKKEKVETQTTVPKESNRSVAGVLTSKVLSRDVKVEQLTLSLHGNVMLEDAELAINYGNRYGLIGPNGSGKTNILQMIATREAPLPEHLSIYHLHREIEATELTALDAVLEPVGKEVEHINAEIDKLLETEEGQNSEVLTSLYERLEELEPETIKKRAGEILFGLGFKREMQHKKTKEFSGGWRMRIALAKALFLAPSMLLLDEPTNHLDLEACVWLENYLSNYKKSLILISHSQDFLNNVCTHIIHLHLRKLQYYTGNYDSYVKTRAEKEENQMKKYEWEQEEIAKMKNYIARFGHGSAKLARQAQSKEKTLAKMEDKGLTEKVAKERVLQLFFDAPGYLPPPVVKFSEVCFGYDEKTELYSKLEFGVTLDSRIALVGPNGVGKSTLLKLFVGELSATKGTISKHPHLKIAWYNQHLTEALDMEMSALDWMMEKFPGELEKERMRSVIGRFGITGKAQTSPMKQLSDGQKSRVVFSWLSYQQPHILLLDEPTNHLDIETIDSLAAAINEFEGGLVLVSHDFRLINQVAEEIWVVENKTITPWKEDILAYKQHLKKRMVIEREKFLKS